MITERIRRPHAMNVFRLSGCLLGLVLACATVPSYAQESARAPGTGDAAVDRQLADIDRYGARYRDAFVDELVRYHGAPRDFVLVLVERDWPLGDIYYACALAYVAGRPCRYVADRYAGGDAVDWQALAQQLGVEPDSPQFGRLKRGIASSYRRWGRPLPLESVAPPPRPALPKDALPEPPPARGPGAGAPLTPPGGREPEGAAKRGDRSGQPKAAGAAVPRR
ncbi:hypothetical protein ACFFGH_02870 [Lysobacter korlensis]|uniref:Lipoprotein n=1 Tax=Lysobacter korlensis TaxID=553636 RepID=A0ABV6RII3_9GAMM